MKKTRIANQEKRRFVQRLPSAFREVSPDINPEFYDLLIYAIIFVTSISRPSSRLVNENEVKQWKEQAETMRKGVFDSSPPQSALIHHIMTRPCWTSR